MVTEAHAPAWSSAAAHCATVQADTFLGTKLWQNHWTNASWRKWSGPKLERRLPTLTGPNPALSIPSLTPKAWTGFRRDRLRLRCRSGQRQFPQAVLFARNRLLCAAPLKSIKSQILSNFTKYPATLTRVTRRQPDGRWLYIIDNATRSKAHTPRYTQSVFSMQVYRMRLRHSW
jgi:hypothetical protein